jgi:hypothetical protein
MWARHGLHRKHLFRCIIGSSVYRSVAQQQVIVMYSLLLPAFVATRMFTESLLSNDDIPLLLRVSTCLPSYCLATVWSNPLQYVYICMHTHTLVYRTVPRIELVTNASKIIHISKSENQNLQQTRLIPVTT